MNVSIYDLRLLRVSSNFKIIFNESRMNLTTILNNLQWPWNQKMREKNRINNHTEYENKHIIITLYEEKTK